VVGVPAVGTVEVEVTEEAYYPLNLTVYRTNQMTLKDCQKAD
jgi:hypothetical protein